MIYQSFLPLKGANDKDEIEFSAHIPGSTIGLCTCCSKRRAYLFTEGMEWVSEMIVNAMLAELSITEVPITLYKYGRSRPMHLKRWRDGRCGLII